MGVSLFVYTLFILDLSIIENESRRPRDGEPRRRSFSRTPFTVNCITLLGKTSSPKLGAQLNKVLEKQ
jgi:hypothetical protein